MKIFSKEIFWLLTLSALILLPGCAPPPVYILPFEALPTNAILLGPDLALLRKKLNHTCGVKIVQQGARLQIMLSTDYFFEYVTTRIDERQEITLRLIALYLHNYLREFANPYPLHVDGYTDTVFLETRRLRLSFRYAQAIADQLSRYGFAGKLMVTGHGSEDPIACQRTLKGSSFNRRVMIQVF